MTMDALVMRLGGPCSTWSIDRLALGRVGRAPQARSDPCEDQDRPDFDQATVKRGARLRKPAHREIRRLLRVRDVVNAGSGRAARFGRPPCSHSCVGESSLTQQPPKKNPPSPTADASSVSIP